ncbi:MAG: putative ABC transport system permease protein [Saprospiraceae bacterium]|jgi:putative ABC transport system permease protein|uniref:ABC transporter permease n=1 Tax=Patiriisocius sp. Uisw_047 TaxID=3230969 RepID=UPI0039E8BAC6
MFIYLRVLKESFNFAINALRNNKLRTFLSLVGVTIGIFSIIAILAAVDSLKKEIEGSISSLDTSTMIITRFSFGPTEVPRWKWQQFPNVNYEEYQLIKRSVNNIEAVAYATNVPNTTVKYEGNTVSDVNFVAITYEHYDIESLQIEEGRYYNESESNSGSQVVVVGYEVATELFGTPTAAIGKKVRMYGRKFTVIGTLEKEGSGLGGDSKDTWVLFPANAARKIFGDSKTNGFQRIIVKPEKGADEVELMAVITQKLRVSRGLKTDDIDTFFINQLKGLVEFIDNITGTMNLVGLMISGFSLLVGGFGIANIMFVSVKERTNLIGIQKSLGAKRRFILLQFLFEAVVLAVFGGLIGMFFVWLLAQGANWYLDDFDFVLSGWNMFIGTSVSIAIGLIAGILPAISASKLDPVEAIRTGM